MIRRLFYRGPAPASDRLATRAEAQIDLRDGQIEGLRDRVGELEREKAQLIAELATYKTREFMTQALRLRRRLAEETTVVTRAADLRQGPKHGRN